VAAETGVAMSDESAVSGGFFGWWREGDSQAHRTFVAASAGWMLDGFDVMLYALVLPRLMADLALDSTTAGFLASTTLVAAAAGGVLFGIVADRAGRTRALRWSVLLYSIFTAACGFAQSAVELTLFRVGLGLGMGGEWASGAALVSETWPDHVRGRVLAFVQSAWAVGYALAAVASYVLQDWMGLDWRAVFFVGVLPALITFWIRRHVEEPPLWRRARTEARPASLSLMLQRPLLGVTVALSLMNAGALFAWWGINSWIPAYLSLPVSQGGVGFSNATMSGLVFVNQVGTWLGYVTFGFVADAIGRRRVYVAYLVLAAVLVWAYTSATSAWMLLVLGPITAFFSTGHFGGFGAVTAELYPTAIRATAQGATYNIGRIVSAAAPWIVGDLARTQGYPSALSISAFAFLFAAVCWIFIPETHGRRITS
jgi:MFS family permease